MIDYSVFGAGHRINGERPVYWQELWRHEFEELRRDRPGGIVAGGSVEKHGPHLPQDVDIVDALALAAATAEAMRPTPVIVSPPIWSGLAHYKKGHIGTITLSFETYIAMV